MTQEEKNLLLKGLCSRELYHPKIRVFNDGYEGFQVGEFDTDLWFHHINAFQFDRVEIKPYLRPMSSMTEEEFKEVTEIDRKRMIFSARHLTWHIDGEVIDFFNRKMLDWRGLISMDLALEAPEDMYKTE